MGRKIPGKKHRGVKDPVKQQTERKEKLKVLINAPPSNPNVQELPKSVLEMNVLRERVKSGNFLKKKKKRKKFLDSGCISGAGPKLKGMEQHDLQFPRLKQKPGESDGAFLSRLDSATNDALNEAKMEAKLDVEVNRNEAGRITDVKPKTKISISNTVQNGSSKKKKRTMNTPTGVSKPKLDYLKERKLKNKLKKIHVNEDDLEKKRDFVKFGEVVHQPPQLKKRPRGCDPSSADRPGKKNLLLSNLLRPGNDNQSMSHRKQIASAREEAVRVYREMKAKNRALSRS